MKQTRKQQRRKAQKKRRHVGKTRRRFNQPKLLSNYSPISSPGSPNSPNSLTLSPSPSPKTPKTPITKRAEELAALYPNIYTMISRSSSFPEGKMSLNEFYEQFEKEFPNANNYYNKHVFKV
jgi:hypothetical protein